MPLNTLTPQHPNTLEQRRFTVAEYHAMGGAGVFAPDERVELLEGQIYRMAPISSRHAWCVDEINRLFNQKLGRDQALVRVQNPVLLDDASEPVPDVALLVPKPDYAQRHPRPDEVLLVVEVALSSLGHDRRRKMPAYARAGIREAWVVAPDEDAVYAYRRPRGDEYAEQRVAERADMLTVAAFPDVTFPADEVLG